MSVLEIAVPQIGLGDLSGANRFVGLFNELYRRKVDERYYRWQYFDDRVQSLLVLTMLGQRLVGTYGGHIYRGRVAARQIPLLCTIDHMVAPHNRRRGLYRQMVNLAADEAAPANIAAMYCMANGNAWPALTGSLGWRLITTLTTMRREAEPLRSGSRDVHFERVTRFDRRHNDLRDRFLRMHEDKMVVERSDSYLNWRFNANPLYSYDSFLVVRHGMPCAYVVLKVFEDPGSGEVFGDIVDLLWAEDDPAVLTNTLRFALAHLYRRGVSQAVMWLQTNTLLDQVGQDLGFVATDQRRYFCCRVMDEEYRWLEDAGRWFITMADSEIY